MDKKKIDKIRESGGMAYVGKKEDGGVVDMITIGDRLIAIKENSVYEMISADKVDPERTTETIPINTAA